MNLNNSRLSNKININNIENSNNNYNYNYTKVIFFRLN